MRDRPSYIDYGEIRSCIRPPTTKTRWSLPIGKNRKPRHKLTFKDAGEIHRSIGMWEMTEEEIENYWVTDEDKLRAQVCLQIIMKVEEIGGGGYKPAYSRPLS